MSNQYMISGIGIVFSQRRKIGGDGAIATSSGKLARDLYQQYSAATRLSNVGSLNSDFITFRVSRRRREMYCGHARLCVCLSAVRGHMLTLLHGPGCNLGKW